ncbi:MAG: hypothetical protein Q9177_003426 [Variospora cf. flavescens]
MAPTTKAGQKDNKKLESVLGQRSPRYFSMQNNAAYGNLTWQLAFAVKLEKTLRRAIQTLPALIESIHRSIESIESIQTSVIASKSRDLDERGTTIWNLTSKYKEDATLPVALALARAFASLLLDCAQHVQSGTVASQDPLIIEQRWASGLTAATDDIRVFKITLKASRWCLGSYILSDSGAAPCTLTGTEQSQLGVTEQIIERAAFYDRRLQHAPQDQFTQELAGMNRRLCKEYQMLRITLAWRRERLDLADIWWSKLDQEQNVLDAPMREQLADTLYEVGRDQAKKQLYNPALQWLERAYDILIAQDQDDLGSDASALKNSIMHCQVHVLLKEPCEENYSRAWDIIHKLENEAENTVAVSLLKLSVLTGDPTAAQEYYNVLIQIIRQINLSDVNVRTILHHVHALKQRNSGLALTLLVLFISERLLVMGEIAWVEKTVVTLLWICTTSTNLGNMTDQLEELLNGVVARSNSAFGASATHAAQVLIVRHIEAAYSRGDYEQADNWCCLALHSIFSNSGESNIGKLQRKRMLCAIGKSDFMRCRDIHHQMSKSTQDEPSTQYLSYRVALRCHDLDLATESLNAIGEAAETDSTLLYACVLEAQRNGNRRQVVRALSCVHSRSGLKTTPGLHISTLLRLIARLLVEELDSQQPQDQDCIDELCNVLDGGLQLQQQQEKMPSLRWNLIGSLAIFIDLYPPDTDPQQTSDRSLRRLFCHFLECCLLVVLARAEDRIQEQYYSELRGTVTKFRMQVKVQLSRLEGGARTDLLRKYVCLITFDFEAAARLGSWASFGDLIEVEVAEKIVDQVIAIVGNAKEVGPSDIGDQCVSSAKEVTLAKQKPGHYPAEELEWIATTAFNRAVDFYYASQDDACRRWAGKAISLANLGDDHGQLHELLQNKYMGLAWDR